MTGLPPPGRHGVEADDHQARKRDNRFELAGDVARVAPSLRQEAARQVDEGEVVIPHDGQHGAGKPIDERPGLLELTWSCPLCQVSRDDYEVGADDLDVGQQRLDQVRAVGTKMDVGQMDDYGHVSANAGRALGSTADREIPGPVRWRPADGRGTASATTLPRATSHTTMTRLPASTSLVQWTPSSTRENATAAVTRPARVSATGPTTRLRAKKEATSAAVTQTSVALAACPEGNEAPCAVTNQRRSGGRGRSMAYLVRVTMLYSPAQATANMRR